MGDSEDEFSSSRNRNKFENECDDIVIKDHQENRNYSYEQTNRNDSYEPRKRNVGHYQQRSNRHQSPSRQNRYENRRNPGYSYSRSYSQPKFGFHPNRKHREIDPSKFMLFKEFVSFQVDNITPTDAVTKYSTYRKEYASQQVVRVFDKYKCFEWFLNKYHPYYITRELITRVRACRKRLILYNRIKDSNILENISLDDHVPRLTAYLHLISQMMEHYSIENLEERITEIQNISLEEQNGETDAAEKPAIKRKPGFTLPSKSDSGLFVNVCIEVSDVPFDIKKNDIIKSFKNVEGFLRVTCEPTSIGKTQTNTFYLTFNKDVDPKATLAAVYECEINGVSFSARIHQPTPQIRPIKCNFDSNKSFIEQSELCLRIISELDSFMYLYRTDLPKLPDFSTKIEASSFAESDNQKYDSEELLPSMSEEGAEGPYDTLTENELIISVKEFLRDYQSNDEGELDSHLIKVLDSLILYLRIVHSFDFYSSSFYENEHFMPNRCCILYTRNNSPSHQRSPLSTTSLVEKSNKFLSTLSTPTQSQFEEFISDRRKSEEKEITNFLTEKSKEIKPGVCTCEICDKKFQGMEYVHKHIHNKHSPYIKNIHFDVLFYNNYVYDCTKNEILCEPLCFDLNLSISMTNESAESTYFQNKRKIFRYNDLDAPEITSFDF